MAKNVVQPANYIALADLDFDWTEQEVFDFQHMWREGLSISEMAQAFHRDADEVAILVMDRIRIGAIENRKGGAFGNHRPI